MVFDFVGQSTRSASKAYDYGLRQYMLGVYNNMVLALIVTAVVAFAASMSEQFVMLTRNPVVYMMLVFGTVGLTFNMHRNLMGMSLERARIMLFIVAGMIGITLSSVFLVFTGVSIVRVFLIASMMFGSLSIYGYTTKRNLGAFATFFFMGVVGILSAVVLNMFLRSTALHFAISTVGVLLFSGITAYDTQMVKNRYYQLCNVHGDSDVLASKVAVIGALSLYIDFINLFVHLLSFFGERK